MCAEPPLSRGPWQVAVVMIARDEAPRIGRALDSLRPWVDRLVVLDTGSRDDTLARARAAGAEVFQMHWGDDFAAARNQALDHAQADWHVVVDADEWLEDGGPALAALRQQAPDFVGVIEVDSQQGDGQGPRAPSALSRVLPGPVRYAGRIHEQPQHDRPLRRLPVRLGHSGYTDAALQAKAGRNAALIAASLREHPDDAYLWYQSGKNHDAYGQWAAAVDDFARARGLLPAQQAPAWLHDLTVRELHALKACGRHAEALARAQAELPRWRHSPDFFFVLGDLLLDWATEQPTLAPQLLPMMEDAWQSCLALGEHPELEGAVRGRGSHLAAHNLALLYDLAGQPTDAARYRHLAVQR